jgi:hypothetical protein
MSGHLALPAPLARGKSRAARAPRALTSQAQMAEAAARSSSSAAARNGPLPNPGTLWNALERFSTLSRNAGCSAERFLARF